MKPPLYFYTENMAPRPGSGAHIRIFSNYRAYQDLGYEVEWIQMKTTDTREEAAPELQIRNHTVVRPEPPLLSAAGKIAYALGMTTDAAWNFYFRTANTLRKEAEKRERATPGAIHHFELPLAGSAIALLRGMKTVWSCLDFESDFVRANIRISCDLEKREPQGWEKRKLRFVTRAERVIAKRSSLVLCIADHEAERMQKDWGCRQAEFLATSMAEERRVPREGWLKDGCLNLLHLGGLAHFPTYRSLEFLIEQVLPRMDAEARERLRLNVVGQISEDAHVKHLLGIAAKWPQVRFLGFVDDIRKIYSECDVHVVAATEATGLRTRIVEAFAWGVPVISTTVGAKGTAGLRPGENIVIADEPQQYADALSRMASPRRLEELAEEGRRTYESIYERGRIAEQMKGLLDTYITGGKHAAL